MAVHNLIEIVGGWLHRGVAVDLSTSPMIGAKVWAQFLVIGVAANRSRP